jgi:hypothetical protein
MESAESSISEEICKGTLIVVSQKSQKHKNYNLLDTTAVKYYSGGTHTQGLEIVKPAKAMHVNSISIHMAIKDTL